LRGKAQEQKNELIRKQTYEYIEYIARLVDIADIMRKDFYVIVPFEPLRAKTRTPMDVVSDMLTPQDTVEKIKKRHKEFDSLRSRVQQRVNVVKGSLRSCQVQSQQLDTQALIELFYESYNPIIAYEEKVDDINTMNLDQDSRLTRE
ncbi:MAG: hypothetical protein U9Q15_03405, partial [Patescibacteria group bacterium]|nr:hypothetical protein [Patescibacteria group bacterium]